MYVVVYLCNEDDNAVTIPGGVELHQCWMLQGTQKAHLFNDLQLLSVGVSAQWTAGVITPRFVHRLAYHMDAPFLHKLRVHDTPCNIHHGFSINTQVHCLEGTFPHELACLIQ